MARANSYSAHNTRVRRRPAPPSHRPLLEQLEARRLLASDVASGLIHHWTFDETSGDVAQDAVGNNDAQLFNWGSTEDKWVQGRVSGALDFSDADNYALTNSGIAKDRYTIAFWLNLQERSGVNPRIIAPQDGSSYILLNNESGEGIGQYFRDGQLHESIRPPNGSLRLVVVETP